MVVLGRSQESECVQGNYWINLFSSLFQIKIGPLVVKQEVAFDLISRTVFL